MHWTNTVKLLPAAESVAGGVNVRRLLVNGSVGDEAGAELTTFLETQTMPDPEGILAAPQTLRLTRHGNLACAIVRSILARAEAQNSVAVGNAAAAFRRDAEMDWLRNGQGRATTTGSHERWRPPLPSLAFTGSDSQAANRVIANHPIMRSKGMSRHGAAYPKKVHSS